MNNIDGVVHNCFQSNGLELLGVVFAESDQIAQNRYIDWLEQGFQGEMNFLVSHVGAKYNPQAIMPAAKSIFFTAINYFQETKKTVGKNGRVSRYAWGRDYHKTFGKRLRNVAVQLSEKFPEHHFRSFIDAGPLDERFFASRAGLGHIGNNGILITKEFGSWCFLGEIISTLEYTNFTKKIKKYKDCPSSATFEPANSVCPPNCLRCVESCPTNALYAPGKIDASRCISYLTIEHKGSIPEKLRPLIGDWLFGCDLCQEVCPSNFFSPTTKELDFLAHRAGPFLDLGKILDMNDESFLQRFAGSPLMRAGRRILQRNACIVAANIGEFSVLPKLKQFAFGQDPLLAEHASWAIKQLQATPNCIETGVYSIKE